MAYVAQRCRAVDEAVDVFLGTFPATEERAICARLAASPRGAWAIFLRERAGASPWYQPRMSAGNGALMAPRDTYDAPPSFEDVYRRMFGYEVYQARCALRAVEETARSTEAIVRHRMAVGSAYRAVTIGHTLYSRVEIIAIERATGRVTLSLTRRGSRRRYGATLPAATLARAAGLDTPR